MNVLEVIVALVVLFVLVLLAYGLLFGRSRRQRALEDERVDTFEDAVAPGRPDFDAPFRRGGGPS